MADATATTAPKPEGDPFGAAFAELSKDDGAPVIVPAADAVLDGAEADAAAAEAKPASIEIEGVLPDPKAVKPDGTAEAGKEVEVGKEAKAGKEAAPAATETKPADTAKDEDMLARFAQIIARTPPAAEAKPAETKPVEPPPAISPYTPEEQQAVDNYIKEWPDVYAAQEALNKRLIQGAVAHVFDQLRPILSQLQGTTEQIATTTYMEQLQSAVPDIAEVAPKLVAWVDQQPDYLKSAFKAVVDKGTVAQVSDLVKRYRAETGAAAPAAGAGATEVKPAVPAKPDPAKIAKGLVPTKGLRSGVQSDMVRSDDFDGAFAAFSQVA